MRKKIILDIELDDNRLPLNIQINTTDGDLQDSDVKALMLSAWCFQNKEALRVDLWTKDMPVQEMFLFYYQTMLTMAETLEKATGEETLSVSLKEYCEFFAKSVNIKK